MKSVEITTFYRLSDEEIQSVRKQYGMTDEIAQLKQLIERQQTQIQTMQAQIQTIMNILSQGQLSPSTKPTVENNRIPISPRKPSAPQRQETSADKFQYGETVSGYIVIVRYIGYDEKVVIPQKINGKMVTVIGNAAFYTGNVSMVDIPDSVVSIGDKAFYDCDNLTAIDIPDKVTHIGSKAFANCNRLAGIRIPNSVVSIGDDAFQRLFGSTLTIFCQKGSYAENYARKNHIKVQYV